MQLPPPTKLHVQQRGNVVHSICNISLEFPAHDKKKSVRSGGALKFLDFTCMLMTLFWTEAGGEKFPERGVMVY